VNYQDTCDALAGAVQRYSSAIAGADLATPVAATPKWTIAGLTKHLGSIQRWCERMVREQARDRLDFRQLDLELPASDEGYPAWFSAGADRLLATLRAADADAPMWAWGADHHVRFWPRRMLHEATVHYADVELALAHLPSIDVRVAVDGVDEFLENLSHAVYFAPRVLELRGEGSLHLHCTDAVGEWMIRLRPDGFDWEHGHGKGDVAVRGSAADLLLLTYGRRSATDGERFQVFGNDGLLSWWQERAAI